MKIEGYHFGSITIDGEQYRKDLLILNGHIHSPWWRKAGGHLFAACDLEILIDAAPELVVLGTGAYGLVRIADDLREAFAACKTKVVAERTGRAVQELTRLLAKGKDVAAALHLTC